MTLARRSRLPNVTTAGAHPGLLLSRYLEMQNSPQVRQALLQAARSAIERTLPVYRPAFERWKQWLGQPCVKSVQLGTGEERRLVIGLGSESPLETGLTLHHTYGVPLIPGSAIKGLVSHYCNASSETLGTEMRCEIREDREGRKTIRTGNDYQVLFGDADMRGYLTFFDAWIVPESVGKCLLADIMTPHHGDYYGEKRYANKPAVPEHLRGTVVAPSDTDNPVPIQFLSIAGDFLFGVQCEDTSAQGVQWRDWAVDLLRSALGDWGIGGKTSSGYGRLHPKQVKLSPPPANGTEVVVVLLEERARNNIGRKVLHEASQLKASVINSADIPEGLVPGTNLVVKVNSNNPTNASVRYVRPA